MINILFCSDNKYASKLAVALSSLLDSNRKIKEKLKIIIRTNDMVENTVVKLKKIIFKYGLSEDQICFVYTDELCNRLEREGVKKFKNSYLCYFKLFGLDELPISDKERLLVIDCDTLICDSILTLYTYDLRGKAIGAVREFPANHTKHGESREGEYNTGVLLYDLEKYSKFHVEKLMKETIKVIPEAEWKTGDQTIFTLALEYANLVETLPLRYNFIINQAHFSYKEFVYIRNIQTFYYSEEEYENARQRPCIMHLISGTFVISPWYYEGNYRIKKLWDGYLKETDWRNCEEEVYMHLPITNRICCYVCRGIYRFLPRRITMRLFRGIYGKFG